MAKDEPAPEKKEARKHTPPEFTFTLKLLLDWSVETYGRLLLMGLMLLFIGGVLTLGSYLMRDDVTGEFHVYKNFLLFGCGCVVAGFVCWIWKRLHKPL